ncbi:hypothetical protein W97_06434 [Coniosporium apollinis CBS 100218]|uniref:Adenylyltransferase and sulfurtransferase uba4 n=1 Tax=Coniosporium apollinis (strain CBS 100218) TaxID=1168221 RepID=R7YZV8_CONA1|nr:uncharacterized protein W97_06434 [Coniosporium apollinis CBS 100218]EON67181.1 hypothetical protein W97_06434 [Coniosporium apollinis CBS 100218]
MASNNPLDSTIEALRSQISACEAQLQALKLQLAEAEARANSTGPSLLSTQYDQDMTNGVPNAWQTDSLSVLGQTNNESNPPSQALDQSPQKWPLTNDEYKRYGRQLIMPEIGLRGQLRLRAASILIIGVGGLGCPAAAYLAGAGVGKIGLVDGDIVEVSNLHRQILHSTATLGMLKVDSAVSYLKALNPGVEYVAYRERLTPESAIETFQSYDLVLDCTDTPASRYLISDACVLLGKPLVSASALRTEGQLMVLNQPARPPGDASGGPCYRCVFPKPPPAASVVSCGEGGILGPVVGVMGVLQALEAIKLVAGRTGTESVEPNGGQESQTNPDPPSLLLFSAYGSPQFRSIRLRSRKPKCAACSTHATVTPEALASGSLDYVQFCGFIGPVDALLPSERLTAYELAADLANTDMHEATARRVGTARPVIVDVREKVQFDLCSLQGSTNVPFSEISTGGESEEWLAKLRSVSPEQPILVVCRLGNDSQVAVKKMKEAGLHGDGKRWVGDLRGGLRAWRENVDPEFPDY